MLRTSRLTVLSLLVTASLAAPVLAHPPVTAPAAVSAALATPSRPAADRDQDADRHAAQVLAFANVHRGDTVIDLMPGTGYYTRLFSALVGPTGKVYAVQPQEMDKVASKELPELKAFAGKPPYDNVTVLEQPIASLKLPANADLVWTSRNYHDLHDKFMGNPDIDTVNRAIFKALKPGGRYLVLDHAATAGSGLAHTDDQHRIDPAQVVKEVTEVGFVEAGQSDAARNPADDHSKTVFDKSIRGHTDQFLIAFRKP